MNNVHFNIGIFSSNYICEHIYFTNMNINKKRKPETCSLNAYYYATSKFTSNVALMISKLYFHILHEAGNKQQYLTSYIVKNSRYYL